ncbi:hypothetical protein R5W24_004170 [Gemmata sp. JC717]|uniref:hypothetical protein n=1 Tax=Gemmata algarum TaxID=2975278 RepID=UPI0021BB9A32|nr:hypothetical protein [Gemmata algarum]MDY3555037.1 hypothetical protein [Gemmata algarum]
MFADWLQEQGGELNADWAAAIRVQVAWAHGVPDAPEPRLLNSQSGVDSVARRLGLPPGIDTGRWERGFPEAVFGSFDAVRAAWPGLIGRVPFRDLRVVESSDDTVADFVTWRGIDRLTALDLRSWRRGLSAAPFGEPALLTVAGCAALSGLTSLKMGYLHLTNSGAAAVMDSPHLKRLRTLQLRRADDTPNLTWHTRTRLTTTFGSNTVL